MKVSWVTVQATVEKVQGNVLYVQTKGNESFPSEYVTLSASFLGEDVQAKEGTVLEITCDGLVFETYPAQFGKVSKVKVISQAEEDGLKGYL